MNKRRELISNALRHRLEAVSARGSNLQPQEFGVASIFVSRVREKLAVAVVEGAYSRLVTPANWMIAELDCLDSLQRLALDDDVATIVGEPPPVSEFLAELKASPNKSDESFRLLTSRYSYPLNFVRPGEDEIREHILLRLMVQDRARIERSSIEMIDPDALLLKLNLISINASHSSDLRFLDALNYYYELLPPNWHPLAKHPWLLASFLVFYSRALAAWPYRESECV